MTFGRKAFASLAPSETISTVGLLELDVFLRQKLVGSVVNVAEGAGFLFTHDQTFEAEPSYDRSQFGEASTSKYDFCRVLVIKRSQLVSSLSGLMLCV